jgi:NTE family protein
MSPLKPLKTIAGRPLGLVLSGGGARGTFQVGVWEVLRHDPRGLRSLPSVISGTSAGALNGALICAGLSPQQMLEFWLDLGRKPPVTANRAFFRGIQNAMATMALKQPTMPLKQRARSARLLPSILAKHLRPFRGSSLAAVMEYVLTAGFHNVSHFLEGIETTYLFNTGAIRERLIETLGGETISHPQCNLAINTVDIRSGRVIRFVNAQPSTHDESDLTNYRVGPISVDVILASASIPILFNPVVVDGLELWDGGLLVNTPIAPALALGAERIVPVLVTPDGDHSPTRPSNFGFAIERLADAFLENAYNTDRKLLLERNRLAEVSPSHHLRVVDLYDAIRPASSSVFDAGSYLYFEPEAMTSMYLAGKEAARAWLNRGPVLDTRPGPHPELAPVRAPLD